MMNYKNRSLTSCVYDAFEQAGLPVSEEMLYGVRIGKTFSLLEQNGYKVFRNGAKVELPSDEGFFVFRTPVNECAHAEYHVSIEGVTEYPSESVCAIAVKR